MQEIIKEYAEALFMIACEENKEEEYLTSLEKILEVLKEEPGYMELLSAPGIPLGERVSAIEAAFGAMVPETVVSFVQLLCEKGRISAYKSCVDEYRRLLNVKLAVTTAYVTSAVALTEAEKTALIRKLERYSGNTVELICKVDPAIIGGLIVEMNDTVMDGSVRHRLREIKDVMSQ